MGSLIVGNLNINDPEIVRQVLSVVQGICSDPTAYHTLRFKPGYYFEILDGAVPQEPGWYIILSGSLPIYVGKANDLNLRLNSSNGSLDNYARLNRPSDAERNFIKRFCELSLITDLRVCLVTESEVSARLGMHSEDLLPCDRGNVEKLVNIFRSSLAFLDETDQLGGQTGG